MYMVAGFAVEAHRRLIRVFDGIQQHQGTGKPFGAAVPPRLDKRFGRKGQNGCYFGVASL